jgi:hypothetical protein
MRFGVFDCRASGTSRELLLRDSVAVDAAAKLQVSQKPRSRATRNQRAVAISAFMLA